MSFSRTLLAAGLLLVGACSFSPPGATGEGEDEDLRIFRDFYGVSLRFTFERDLFGHAPGGGPVIQPFDEGILTVRHPGLEVPSEWQVSQVAVDHVVAGTTDAIITGVTVHPDLESTALRAIPLPAYLCGVLAVNPAHRFDYDAPFPVAISSSCVPVPSQLRDVSIEEAERFLPSNRVIEEEVVINIDTLVSKDSADYVTLGRFNQFLPDLE